MDFKNVPIPDFINPPEPIDKGKTVINTKELSQWINERKKLGCSFKAEKGFVSDIYYNDGTPIDSMVNVAWVCNETQEKFVMEWGYEHDKSYA